MAFYWLYLASGCLKVAIAAYILTVAFAVAAIIRALRNNAMPDALWQTIVTSYVTVNIAMIVSAIPATISVVLALRSGVRLCICREVKVARLMNHWPPRILSLQDPWQLKILAAYIVLAGLLLWIGMLWILTVIFDADRHPGVGLLLLFACLLGPIILSTRLNRIWTRIIPTSADEIWGNGSFDLSLNAARVMIP